MRTIKLLKPAKDKPQDKTSQIPNLLTIDFEDWFQGIQLEKKWQHTAFKSRLERTTNIILEILNQKELYATFFILGVNAERYPSLIQQIASEGHEIACHGYDHQTLNYKTAKEFKEDITKSLDILQKTTNCNVKGFRAPWWSITEKNLWVLNCLVDCGFKYDSSLFPVKTPYYGLTKGPKAPCRVKIGNASLIELPPVTCQLLWKKVPVAGGFFMRNFPLTWSMTGIRNNNTRGYPGMIYFHPWELDPDPPFEWFSLSQNLIHYTGLKRTRSRLLQLLDKFPFTSIERSGILEAPLKEYNL